MTQNATPFILFTEHDLRPDTPHLQVGLALGRKLTADSKCHVLVTIQRAHDAHQEPCIFSWSQQDDGFGPSGFLLYRHTANGLRKIDIDADSLAAPQTPFLVDGWNSSLRELAPKGRVRFMATLPDRYRKELAPGAKYELVWPGGEISIWDWGTARQHLNQELSAKLPKICLPSARVTLEFDKFGPAAEERQGSPPPIAPSERIPGAPKLNVILECEKTVAQAGAAHVKISVVYEAEPDSSPIIFHSYPFLSWYGPREGYRLYRRRGDIWQTVEDDTTGFMIVDDPDVAVNVSQDDNFYSLQAGQTWTTSHRLEGQGKGILPNDVTAGDVFRYVFKGVEVDWWDWGGKEEHLETIVKLPCFLKGKVVEPKDNDGRQQLVVPASNSVEFTII